MEKYRIKVTTYNDGSQWFVLQEKIWWWWSDVRFYCHDVLGMRTVQGPTRKEVGVKLQELLNKRIKSIRTEVIINELTK